MKTTTKITSVNKNHSIENDDGIAISNNVKPKTEIFGVIGFMLGLGGLFAALAPLYLPVYGLGIIFIALGLSVFSFIFGMISWMKIENNPHHYKGKWIAFASLYLGYIGWGFFLANLTIFSIFFFLGAL